MLFVASNYREVGHQTLPQYCAIFGNFKVPLFWVFVTAALPRFTVGKLPESFVKRNLLSSPQFVPIRMQTIFFAREGQEISVSDQGL